MRAAFFAAYGQSAQGHHPCQCVCAVIRCPVLRVDNVLEFPGHIACDSASRSEIVLPLIKKDTCIGVLDIDSARLRRFDETDEAGLNAFVDVLIRFL